MAALTMVRVPGSKVPTLRCQGVLTLDTGEALRREIALWTHNGAPRLVVNIDRLHALDRDGAAVLAEIAELTASRGKQLVLVAGTDSARGLLDSMEIDTAIAVFDTEEGAVSLLLTKLELLKT